MSASLAFATIVFVCGVGFAFLDRERDRRHKVSERVAAESWLREQTRANDLQAQRAHERQLELIEGRRALQREYFEGLLRARADQGDEWKHG